MTLVLATLAAASCLPLPPAAERITAADLAGGWPALAAAGSGTAVAFAPAPGVQRVFSAGELQRIGARLGVDSEPPGPVCVERASAPLDPAALLASMQRVLPEAEIEIVEYGRAAAPAGEVVFPKALLQPSGLWKGYIEYAPSRRFSIWARVKVRLTVTQVVATETLPAGKTIAAPQLRLETVTAAPGAAVGAQSIEEVAGRIALRSIAAGKPVPRAQLAEAPDVTRGQSVRVEVHHGATRLETEGLAQANGRRGDRVLIQNPTSGRRFLARVAGEGLVVVGDEKEHEN